MALLGAGTVRSISAATAPNAVHYGLGTWLTLVAGAALFLDTPGLFWLLAVAGGGGYAVAAVLERRRLAARSTNAW